MRTLLTAAEAEVPSCVGLAGEGEVALMLLSQHPFCLYDLLIDCPRPDAVSIERMYLGSENITGRLLGKKSVQRLTEAHATGRLQGLTLRADAPLCIIVKNRGNTTQRVSCNALGTDGEGVLFP